MQRVWTEDSMHPKAMAAAAAHYPYLQGLWTVPMGFLILFIGLANLQQRPADPVLVGLFGGALLLSWLAARRTARYYRQYYGAVTPTRNRNLQYAGALVAWVAVLFIGGSKFLFCRLIRRCASTPRRSLWPRWCTTRYRWGCGRTTS